MLDVACKCICPLCFEYRVLATSQALSSCGPWWHEERQIEIKVRQPQGQVLMAPAAVAAAVTVTVTVTATPITAQL